MNTQQTTVTPLKIDDFSQSPYVLKKVEQARATLARFLVPDEYRR